VHSRLCLFQLNDDVANVSFKSLRIALFNLQDSLVWVGLGLQLLELMFNVTMLVQHLSHLVYVINRIDDLVSFLFRFVLLSNLVFELIVELSVNLLNLFDLSLNFLHFFRFCVHFLGHLLDLTLFLLANCLHLLSNGNFTLPKIPILLLQVDESVAELIDKKFFLVLG